VTQAGKDDPLWKQCLNAVCPIGYGQYYKGIKESASVQLNGLEEKKSVIR